METKQINKIQYLTRYNFGTYPPTLDDVIEMIPQGHKLVSLSIFPTRISSTGTQQKEYVGFIATERLNEK